MRKIQPECFKGGQLLYRFRNRTYLEQPTRTSVKYYIEGREPGLFVAVLRRERHLLPAFLSVVLCMVLLLYRGLSVEGVSLTMTGDLYSDGYIVGLNVRNDIESFHYVEVRLLKDGKAITNYIGLRPGEDVGNVKQLGYIMPGSYNCSLRVRIWLGKISVFKEYPVLLIVRSK